MNSKRLFASLIAAILLFTSFCIPTVAADEEFTPALSYTKKVNIVISSSNILTDSTLSPFGVDVKLLDTNIVALDGATTEHRVTIKSISSQRDGQELVTYDPENPEPFLDVFRFTETDEDGEIIRKSLPLNIEIQIDFADDRIFGELGYEITVSGFSTPPDLGIGIDIGDSVAVPTDIVRTYTINEFPTLVSLTPTSLPSKKFYTDAEKPELDGISINVETSAGEKGSVTYGAANAHAFTTVPEKSEKLIAGTEEISTFFYGQLISAIPVTVEHDWSNGFVSITTDKYIPPTVDAEGNSSEGKPGYHAIVCNGCGETHSAAKHVVDENAWVYNNDQTFTSNGTSSTVCLDCGATLTMDVLGSADYNTAFENYHFLKVIFDYINMILRLISNAGIN